MTFSQRLAAGGAPKNICVQAVLPAATKTEIWKRAGVDRFQIPSVMEVDELLYAALFGLDHREEVTIPALAGEMFWQANEGERTILPSGSGQRQQTVTLLNGYIYKLNGSHGRRSVCTNGPRA